MSPLIYTIIPKYFTRNISRGDISREDKSLPRFRKITVNKKASFPADTLVYCSQMDWTRKEGRVRIEEGVMKVVNFNF